MSLASLRVELMETCTQAKAHPLTQGHVPTYSDLLVKWADIFAQELALRDGITAAKVRMLWIDVTLNVLAGRVSKAILTLTNDERSRPLYIAYFGNKTLGEFRRPQLAAQLEGMRHWIPQLTGSNVPALVELAPEIAAIVVEADEAVVTHALLEQQLAYFREAGERKKFFDEVNAVRKETFGELSKLPYQHESLPSNFADLFFLHREEKEEEVETIESEKAAIADLSQQIAKHQARLLELEAEAVEEAKKAAEREARKALAEQLEKEAVEAEQQAKAKRATIAELDLE